MSRKIGSELTTELFERLNGRDVSPHEGKIIPLITLDEAGRPHPALLSYYEVVAKDRSTLDIGIWKNSSTANNIRRNANLAFMITDTAVNFYLKGTAREVQAELPSMQQVSRFRITLSEVLEDQEANAQITTGLTYTRTKPREDSDISAIVLAGLLQEP
jgi:hypothetical protein